MECPVCGKDCEDLTLIKYEADFEDLADHVFKTLVEKGYAASYDNINMLLEIIYNYMTEFGENDIDEDERSR
jgi:hypothetical protein